MRTTLDIDPDILAAAKAIARKERSSAGRVISELARLSLTSSRSNDSNQLSEPAVRYGVPVIAPGKKPVTHAFVDELMDQEGV